jgi:hypothetical protein
MAAAVHGLLGAQFMTKKASRKCTPRQEAQLLQSLLGKHGPEHFTSEQLSRKAHWRWNREKFLEAAVLFDAAASRCAEENRLAAPKQDWTFSKRVRAGVTFRLAGQYERAWPILVEATTFDWNAAGIPEDDHFTEWAYVEMLCIHAEAEERDAFSRVFWEAVARCRELGSPFPRIYPKQDLLFDLCERLALQKELEHVAERITWRQGKLPRQLADRLKSLSEYSS